MLFFVPSIESFFSVSYLYDFEFVEAAKRERENLSSVSAKLNYSRMADKKSSIAIFDFQLLEGATNNFSRDNIMGESGSRIVYRARFDEHFKAAVKKADSDADREFEVIDDPL